MGGGKKSGANYPSLSFAWKGKGGGGGKKEREEGRERKWRSEIVSSPLSAEQGEKGEKGEKKDRGGGEFFGCLVFGVSCTDGEREGGREREKKEGRIDRDCGPLFLLPSGKDLKEEREKKEGGNRIVSPFSVDYIGRRKHKGREKKRRKERGK